jgi:hypothetical protein
MPILLAIAAAGLAGLACSMADSGGAGGSALQDAVEILPGLENDLPEMDANQPAPGDVLFSDDFSDTSSGWDQENYDTGLTDYAAGEYQILVNEANYDYWANPGLNLSDVIIDVDTTRAAGPADNDIGVICRYQDVDNFYAMLISSDGFYAIAKNEGSGLSSLGQEQMLPSDAVNTDSAENHITASCIGQTLTLSVNGVQVAQVTDDSFASGDVGLIAGTYDSPGVDVRFDNFVVRKP